MKLKETGFEFVRFTIVGCIAVAIQYIVYYLCLQFLSHNIAFVLGYVLSFIFNYIMTTAFTFRARRNKKNLAGFISCHLVNFLLQVGLLNLFIMMGLAKEIALIPVLAICVPSNFLLIRLVMKNV